MTLFDRLQRALDPAAPGAVAVEDERDFGTPAGGHRAAAVLIPITDRAEPGVILTQRPQWLRAHAGQVAFPGGKVDAGDQNEIDAALREAEEELGLSRRDVQVVGATDPYLSGSGYHITPVLGLIPPDLPFDPNGDEVEAWFEVPMAELFDIARYARHEVEWGGRPRTYFEWHWQDRRIWGVTAGIIVNLARRLAL